MPHSGAVDRKTPRSRPTPWQYGLRELCLFVAAVGMALTVVLADLPWHHILNLFPFLAAACGLLALSIYVGWIRKDCFTATWLAVLAWYLVLLGVLLGIVEGVALIGMAYRHEVSLELETIPALFSGLPLPLLLSTPLVFLVLGCRRALNSWVIRLLVVALLIGFADILILLQGTLRIFTYRLHTDFYEW